VGGDTLRLTARIMPSHHLDVRIQKQKLEFVGRGGARRMPSARRRISGKLEGDA